jgi:ubiquinone/menaquinone biosynthesis C-methylase UbiE
MTTFKDFSFARNSYNKFRPSYPPELYQALLERSPDREFAVDVGAGSGQATVELAKHFKKVIGFDPSPGMLEQSRDLPVEIRTGIAEKIEVESGTVSLLTSAQAAHWFTLDQFFPEVQRVLKPGGVMALWGYGLCHLDDPRSDKVLKYLYTDVLGKYWDEERKKIENEYRDIQPNFGKVERLEFSMKKKMPLNDFMGYLTTWSAWSNYRKQFPDKEDPHVEVYKKIAESIGENGVLELTFPLFMILTKKV